MKYTDSHVTILLLNISSTPDKLLATFNLEISSSPDRIILVKWVRGTLHGTVIFTARWAIIGCPAVCQVTARPVAMG
jgi:hypothetical protein